jgi:hypothetical protein
MLVRALTLLLVAWTAHAQPIFVGPEFQVNTYTTSTQSMPAVAVDPAGNFVVVWSSDGSVGSDASGFSIQGQRYDSLGTALGTQFQVNTYAPGNQFVPVVACDASGGCIVVWESDGSAASDASGASIQGQLYDGSGAPVGGEFQVNTYTTSTQADPAVAIDPAGNFVVAWQSNGSAGTDTHYGSIQAQRYDGAGAPLGGEFQVNTYTTFGQGAPAVAADGAGNFVVVWESAVLGIGSKGVRGQRYDAGGTPLGGEFQVSTYTEPQYMPAVSADTVGNFVVAWYGFNPTSYAGIKGRRYDANGMALGGEFEVDNAIGGGISPEIAVGETDFLVVWLSYVSPGSDTDGISIQARRFDEAASPQGGQFQVNTYTTNYQAPAAVGTDGAGNFVVAWHSLAGNGMSDPNSSVQAQRIAFVPTTTSSSSTSTTSSSSSSSSTSSSSSSTSTSSTSSSTTTSSTSTTIPPPVLLPGRTATVRDQALAQFVSRPANGGFPLPGVDLVATGATLRVFDTAAAAGDDAYDLPAGSRWRGLGNPPGAKGYRYKGAGDAADPCKIVLVKESIIKAICRGAGVTLRPPFTGDVGIVLSFGTSERYCARFGGDDVRNDSTLTKRRNAPAPGACP